MPSRITEDKEQTTNGAEINSLVGQMYAKGPNKTFAGSLCQVIKALLQSGEPSLDLLANCVGLKPRTLPRELANEGTKFRQVLDQARLEYAAALIKSDDLRTHGIAQLVGYTDGPHFARAFRRWTGMSPGEYRRQQQRN